MKEFIGKVTAPPSPGNTRKTVACPDLLYCRSFRTAHRKPSWWLWTGGGWCQNTGTLCAVPHGQCLQWQCALFMPAVLSKWGNTGSGYGGRQSSWRTMSTTNAAWGTSCGYTSPGAACMQAALCFACHLHMHALNQAPDARVALRAAGRSVRTRRGA